jgi:hypothetical protein
MVEALPPIFQDDTWYGLGLMVHDEPGPTQTLARRRESSVRDFPDLRLNPLLAGG